MLSTAQLSLLCWWFGTDAVLRCATIGGCRVFYFPLALLHLGGSVLGFSIADFDKIVNTFLAPPWFPHQNKDRFTSNKPTSLQTPPLHFRQILPWADQLLCFCNSFHYIIMKS